MRDVVCMIMRMSGEREKQCNYTQSTDTHSHLTRENVPGERQICQLYKNYYARYLGLGMRYEAGICTTVIGIRNDVLKKIFILVTFLPKIAVDQRL